MIDQSPELPAAVPAAGRNRLVVMQWALVAACGVLWLWLAAQCVAAGMPPAAWSLQEILLLLAGSVTVVVSAVSQLPLLNVVLIAAWVTAGSALAQFLAHDAGLWLTPRVTSIGPSMGGVVPWWLPPAWIIALSGSRSIGRLILRTRRRARFYGFVLLALSTVLSLFVYFGLWLRSGATGAGNLACGAAAWAIVAGILQVGAVPLVIDKLPRERPVEFAAPTAWVLWNSAWVVFCLCSGSYRSAVCGAIGVAVAVGLALRGACRSELPGSMRQS